MRIIKWPAVTREVLPYGIPGRAYFGECVVELTEAESQQYLEDISHYSASLTSKNFSMGDYVEKLEDKYCKIYNILPIENIYDNVWRCVIDYVDYDSIEAQKEIEDRTLNESFGIIGEIL